MGFMVVLQRSVDLYKVAKIAFCISSLVKNGLKRTEDGEFRNFNARVVLLWPPYEALEEKLGR
mgnify:CR=1 FL=1